MSAQAGSGLRGEEFKDMTIKLEIELLPPYREKADSGKHSLELEEALTLRQLARHLSRQWKERLNFALIDDKKLLTAEFMVNGRHASLEQVTEDGDRITVIPYIGGG